MTDAKHASQATWLPCPNDTCAPELTGANCLSCPAVVKVCPTCHGDGTVPTNQKENP